MKRKYMTQVDMARLSTGFTIGKNVEDELAQSPTTESGATYLIVKGEANYRDLEPMLGDRYFRMGIRNGRVIRQMEKNEELRRSV